jgi:hypothetical protein
MKSTDSPGNMTDQMLMTYLVFLNPKNRAELIDY